MDEDTEVFFRQVGPLVFVIADTMTETVLRALQNELAGQLGKSAGNIIFTEDNKICIIDFGLMIQLSAKDRQTFYNLATYFAIHDFDNTIKLFISELLGPDDVKQLLTTTQLNELKESMIKILYSLCVVDKKFTFQDIHAIIRVVNKYKLNLSSLCYHLMLFIVSGESLMKELSPDYMSFFIDKIKILSDFEFEE
jgi:predicted unusual protein kinase regulating ubiquinone biosynthesis (AarF/ABC1/UbiB family)